jgi:hypothetical protein
MSNQSKPTPNANPGKLARAAKTGAQRVGRAAVVARDGAVVAAGAAAAGAKAVADASSDFARKTGKFVDAKSREFLDAEFAKHRPSGIANVARLRKANSGATPAHIIDLLSAEFMNEGKGVPAKSEKFLAASTTFVVTLNEIYGDRVRDDTQRQILLYLLLAANSNVARVVAQVGMLALAFATKRFGAIAAGVATALAWVKKNAGKLSWVTALAKLAQIDNAGRKSASWIVVNASLKILGPAPTEWPDSGAKTSAAKKPAAKPKKSA